MRGKCPAVSKTGQQTLCALLNECFRLAEFLPEYAGIPSQFGWRVLLDPNWTESSFRDEKSHLGHLNRGAYNALKDIEPHPIEISQDPVLMKSRYPSVISVPVMQKDSGKLSAAEASSAIRIRKVLRVPIGRL